MKPQKQKYIHAPDQGIWGDCERTAIACLLNMDRDSVPHFAENFRSHEEVIYKERVWLGEHGLVPFACPFKCDLPELLKFMAVNNPGLYYLLSGTSRTGCNHTVVALDDQIVWDPSLSDSGIIGPCDDGYYWIKLYVPRSLSCTP